MTLVISTTTPEGIVLAADSRQSYRNNKGVSRVGSDNASKLFYVNNRVGIATSGIAFLPENGVPKNISKFISDFRRLPGIEQMKVDEIVNQVNSFFNEKYKWQQSLDKLVENIKADLLNRKCQFINAEKEGNMVKYIFKDIQGNMINQVAWIDMISFLITGYNKDGTHEGYFCHIPGNIIKRNDSKEKGKEYGVNWIGQSDVVSRIILGFDPRIENLNFVNNAIKTLGVEQALAQLRNLEYSIQWGTMTLQDAIDFCVLMIKTTSAIQRFSDGISADPGDIPGVGGHVDVAVITPDKGFVWVSKKKLNVDNSEIDLDQAYDLKILDKAIPL